jgi:hypothetical protein
MKEIASKYYCYKLYETSKGPLLSNVCGTVAIYELNFLLSEPEKRVYEEDGIRFIDKLSAEVISDPKKYQSRHIELNDVE